MSRDAESVFHAARQHSANERDVFLDGACGKDVGVRAKVEALLTAGRLCYMVFGLIAINPATSD